MEKTDWTAFDAVWNRVSGASAESPAVPAGKKVSPPRKEAEDTARLRLFLEETAAAERAYRAITARTSLRWLQELCGKLRQQETVHKRRLQSAYFLLTGDTCPLREVPGAQAPLLEMLRSRLLCERASAGAYREAARAADSMELSRLFTELAGEEARHGELLHAAVTRLLS